MRKDYSARLTALRNRRLGLDGNQQLLSKSANAILDSLNLEERYQVRGRLKTVKYALGTMQEIDPKITENYYEEATRVRNQLNANLSVRVSFELQGSVPLNIHIRAASDIDLLVLHEEFLNADLNGPRAFTYKLHKGTSIITTTLALRTECERILADRFPQAKVDTSGAKSISISEGSLRHKVDVVPAHWHDSAAYQASGQKHDREVRVVDKYTYKSISNWPFLHIKRIDEKDNETWGGAKKVIRLLKCLRRDSEQQIDLSSYEIAGIVWNMPSQYLRRADTNDLGLLAVADIFLNNLVSNSYYAGSLVAPDGSRKVIENDSAFLSLGLLHNEVRELVNDLAEESGISQASLDSKWGVLLESQL